jgi:hypothetical protein
MAMDGLEGGRVDRIWRWPFHYWMAVRGEYLKIKTGRPAKSEPKGDVVEIAPGVTIERKQRGVELGDRVDER